MGSRASSKTQPDDATKLRIECATRDTQLRSHWDDFSSLVQESMSQNVDPTALVKKVVEVVRAGIIATRNWIKDCGDYIPEATERYEWLIREMSSKLDQLSK